MLVDFLNARVRTQSRKGRINCWVVMVSSVQQWLEFLPKLAHLALFMFIP